MNLTMINNLVFCIEKIPCSGHNCHEKNNQLMRLSLLKKSRNIEKFENITKSAIKFIIRESKNGDL